MSIARNELVSDDALDVAASPVSRSTPPRPGVDAGAPSRVRRRDAYLVAVAAGLAAIGVCVASYLSDARRHAQPTPSAGAVEP